MRIDVITIFPDYLAPLELSLAGKARAAGWLEVRVHDLRGWAHDRHRTVDDTPYGGGAGMVMRPEPWGEALDGVMGGVEPRPTLVIPTPSGRTFTQAHAERLAGRDRLVFACGRYEGIDQRVIDEAASHGPVEELSLGDYVLSGGEVAALVLIEAVTRLLPGFVGNPQSLAEESHGTGEDGGLLEYPVYTKPPVWRGRQVPDVLLSGNHGRIARWRRDESLRRTRGRRPDLVARIDRAALDARDRDVLGEPEG
ncbi:MAG: tRNA (guanosine(37)-N1)-methyltransferase TrmD [Nocardioidaceae bacterium]